MHQQPARHVPSKYRALRTRKRGPENRTKKKQERRSRTEPPGVYDQRRKKPEEEQSQRVIKSSFLSGSFGSPDGSEQYVAVMNATFSAPRSLVPIDSCRVGAHNPAFSQQASYITGGVYVKPQQVSLVNHRPFIFFAPEVAVENLLHQRSISATEVQQTSRERETNKIETGST
jgi:transcription initiation factor TFIIH subunit 3